jgi:hypothetical protein
MAIFPVLLLLMAHLVLTALPGSAAALVTARRWPMPLPVLLGIWLAAGGVVAMLSFWLYYAQPGIGKTFSIAVMAASAAAIVHSLLAGGLDRALLRQIVTPLALWVLGSIFIVCLGFAHGGSDTSIATSASRFTSGSLPSDNDIPRFFTEWFYAHGHVGTPPVYPGDWLSSDRPPLQIGYELLQRPFGWDAKGLNYELVAVTLQQFWIVGLWALLLAARVGRITRTLAMIVVLVSGLGIVNGFYVWPKMLPAAMVLAAAALVMTPLWYGIRTRSAGGALVAVLVALAMLGHGSSVFGVIPLVLLAIYRGIPSWRWIAVGLGVGILLMVPWSLYQKYGDPPGNRLTKWMLAGDIEVNDKNPARDIIDAYSDAGFGKVVDHKVDNLRIVLGSVEGVAPFSDAVRALGDRDIAKAIQQARFLFYLCLLPSFGLLLVAPLLMLLARWRRKVSGDDWAFARTGLLVFATAVVAWVLIVFGNVPARTSIHVGSFAVPIIGYCAVVAGLRGVYPRVAVYLVGVWAVVSLAMYVPAYTPQPGTSYLVAPFVIGAVALAAFVVLAVRGSRSRAEDLPAASAVL